jgi:hypothetical protein
MTDLPSSKPFPHEKLEANLTLLNRRSKLALQALKEVPDPGYLYSLQLASVALERGLYQPKGQELELTVHGMFGWKPENAQKYLEENANGEPIELTPDGRPNPEDLAAAILGEVEHKLSLPSGSNYPTMPKG